MVRGKSRDDLRKEWDQIPKDWFCTYTWQSLANATYFEEIAGLLVKDFHLIELDDKDLRQRNFRLSSHKGQCALNTSIEQLTEKRFVRALYNLGTLGSLGEILDYEIPLKGSRQALHGDIDLISLNQSGLLVIEAKQPNSRESLLKAILQAYTYTCLVHSRKNRFMNEYGLDTRIHLIPALLTFSSASSGNQLMTLPRHRNIQSLLKLLNDGLSKLGEGKFVFYLSKQRQENLNGSLKALPFDLHNQKILFIDGFVPRFQQVSV